MKKIALLPNFFVVFISLLLTACGMPKATEVGLNEEIVLDEATVKILSIESTDSLKSNLDGKILRPPAGKKYVIATFEFTSNSDSLKYVSDVGVGLYKDDVTSGIANENEELTGAYLMTDYIDPNTVWDLSKTQKGQTLKVQQIYEIDATAVGLKFRVGKKFSWKDLHSIDVDKVITQRKGPEILAQMKDFMGMLDGTDKSVRAALDKHHVMGASRSDEGSVDMGMYTLEEPEIVSEKQAGDQTCYKLKTKSGATERTFDMCWQNGKIQSVVDKGITPGVMR